MNLALLAHEATGELLVVDRSEILKYSNDYKEVVAMCQYSPAQICSVFTEFMERKYQQMISFDVKE